MLKILLDNRREHHHKRAKRGHSQLDFKPGKLVIANVLIYLDAENDIVGKSSYQTRRPFIILENSNHGFYIIRKLGDSSVLKSKFMSEELHLLSLCTLPCDPINSSDCQFVNSVSLSIIHILKKSLNIEMYNERWFHNKPETHPPKLDYYKVHPFTSVPKVFCPPLVKLLYNNNVLYSTHPRKRSLCSS